MRRQRMKAWGPGFLLFTAMLGVFACADSVQAQSAVSDPADKIHFRLRELIGRGLPLPPEEKGLVRIDGQNRVQVYIRAAPASDALLDQITALGGKVDGQALGVIQAWIPVQALELLAA